ncbi:MAG: hypothetical protein ACYTGQ_17515, partial [Planctomycetota bacterium]
MVFNSLRTRIGLGFGLAMALLITGGYVSIWQLRRITELLGTDQPARLQVIDAAHRLSSGVTESQHATRLALTTDDPEVGALAMGIWGEVISPARADLNRLADSNPQGLRGELRYELQLIGARLDELAQDQIDARDLTHSGAPTQDAEPLGPRVEPFTRRTRQLIDRVVLTEWSHQPSEDRQPLRADLRATQANLSKGLAALDRYVGEARSTDFDAWARCVNAHVALRGSLEGHVALLGAAQVAELAALDEAVGQIHTLAREDRLLRDGRPVDPGRLYFEREAAPKANQVAERLRGLIGRQRDRITQSHAAAHDRIQLLGGFHWALLVVGLMCCVACAVYLSGSIALPLRRLALAGRRVAASDPDATVEYEGPLEVRQVADAIGQFKARQEAVSRAVGALAVGRLDEGFRPANGADTLALSFQRLTDTLGDAQARIDQMAQGLAPDEVGPWNDDDGFGRSLHTMAGRLAEVIETLESVGRGDKESTEPLTPISDRDRLGAAVNGVVGRLNLQVLAAAEAAAQGEVDRRSVVEAEESRACLEALQKQIESAIVVLDSAAQGDLAVAQNDTPPEGPLGQSVERVIDRLAGGGETTHAEHEAAEALRRQLDSVIHAIDAAADGEGSAEAVEA